MQTVQGTYYKCEKCGKLYTRRDSIGRHCRECGQIGKFCCDYCKKKFKRKEHLASHIWIVHENRVNHRNNLQNSTAYI